MRGAIQLLLLCTSAAAAKQPRHVVFVVIDDLGYDDFGFANDNQIKTPTFNSLHDEGIALSQYYVQPSCSPTRATFLTGRKPVHTGVNVWIPNLPYGLPLNETTLAQVLNARGFVSHAVGKWHLGCHLTPFLPTFRGFDSFYGYYEGSEDYFTHNFYGNGLDFHREEGRRCGANCTELLWDAVGQYSTTLFSQRAVQLIADHNADPVSDGKPLFLYLAYQGVHEPAQAPQSYVDAYNETGPSGFIADKRRRLFAGMLSALDEGLANVTGALKANTHSDGTSMFDETLFIVTTDTGGPTTECSTTGQSNWPLRGSKCSIWEGGTKGAGYMYWSGLPDGARGLDYGGLIHAADWLPTIVGAVGATPLGPSDTLPLDGLDMWDTLMTNAASPRKEVYYGVNQGGGGPAVRDTDGWKLIISDNAGGGKGNWSKQQLPNSSSTERAAIAAVPTGWGMADWPQAAAVETPMLLYNIVSDKGEHTPLSLAKHNETVRRLQAIVDFYAKTKVPQLTADPNCPKFTGLNSSKGKYIGPWCDNVTRVR